MMTKNDTNNKHSESGSSLSLLWKKFSSSNLIWSVVALIVLIIICTISDHSFLSLSWNTNTGGLAGPLITMLQESARYLMIATGMTLVISTSGIDLSVGSVMAVAGAAAMQMLSGGMNVWLAIAFSLIIGLAVGCINGALIAFLGLQPFITTLIMMLAGRGLAKVITSGQNTDAGSAPGIGPLKWMANGFILGIPANFVIAILIVVLVGLLMRKTAMGMMVESVGINAEASRMTGIKPKKILFTVYALSGLLAAIAGLFATASVMRVDVVKTGQDLEMYAILAVVIGGTSLLGGKFSLSGSALGAIIIAMIRKTIITLGVDAAATPAFFAVVVIVICVMQAPKIHNLGAERKRKQALKAQAKAVSA
jgi:simple sugar transport system permease protein